MFEKYDGGGKRNKRNKERIIRSQNKNKNENGRTETKEGVRTSEYEVYINNV